MLTAPETTKLPAGVQKDIENARANLDMLNSENTRQMNSYRDTSKKVVEAEKRLEWVNQENIKSTARQADLLKEIETLTENKATLIKEVSKQTELHRISEKDMQFKYDNLTKLQKDTEKASLDLGESVKIHLKNHAKLQEDLKDFETKKSILTTALASI